MEIIRKEICLDDYRSHVQGLLPYVTYNEEQPYTITHNSFDNWVTDSKDNGNWGNFVCDILVSSGDTTFTDLFSYLNDDDHLTLIESGSTPVLDDKHEYVFDDETQKPKLTTFTFIRLMEVMRRYNYMMYLIRNGIKLREITTKSCDSGIGNRLFISDNSEKLLNYTPYDVESSLIDSFGRYSLKNNDEKGYVVPSTDKNWVVLIEDYEIFNKFGGLDFINDVFNKFIGSVAVPDNVNGSSVPPYFPIVDIEEELEWLNQYKGTKDCCQLQQWNARGGQEMIDFLSGVEIDETHKEIKPLVPTMEINLCFVQDMKDNGLYTDYDPYNEEYEYEGDGVLKPNFIEYESGLTLESKLKLIRNTDYFMTDTEVLPGVFQTFENGSKFFKCIYNTGYTKIEHIKVVKEQEINGEWYIIDTTNTSNPIDDTFNVRDGAEVFNIDSSIVVDPTTSTVVESTEDEVKYRETTYTTIETVNYTWWEAIDADGEKGSLKCADGETIVANTKKYWTTTIFETIRSLTLNLFVKDDDTIYFLVKYNNTQESPMEIPYVTNTPVNVYAVSYENDEGKTIYIGSNDVEYEEDEIDGKSLKFIGDYIISIKNEERSGLTFYDFDYVVGGVFYAYAKKTDDGLSLTWDGYKEKTGIHYKESYPYNESVPMYVMIDDNPDTLIYVNQLNYNSDLVEVYSEDYRLSRETNIAEVNGFITGDIWHGSTPERSSESINTPIFKDDFYNGISMPTKYEISVEVDRGSASAWESHFKLFECNTFEDLENYGNNFFNL